MTVWLWAAVLALALALAAAAIKIHLMRRAADEIRRALPNALAEDTNILIDLGCRDGRMRALAASLNAQLRLLRAARARYRQGDAELKQAVTNLSHDLRTPLTAIGGYLDLLSQTTDDPAVRRYIPILRERVAAMRALTEELFRFSLITAAPDPDRAAPVRLNDALEESVVGYYAALTERGIAPEIAVPERAVWRTLDKTSLRRVFDNLIGNALKYAQGDLSIALTEDGAISFANATSALDAVGAEKLFDRYYTVESGRRATGLGLSIARTLTERMGGSIRAECAAGRLVVTVCFPEDAATDRQC